MSGEEKVLCPQCQTEGKRSKVILYPGQTVPKMKFTDGYWDENGDRSCPNCNEPNKPDSKFCAKCRIVLTYDAYNETLEEQKIKEDKLLEMDKKFNLIQSQNYLIIVLTSIKVNLRPAK
jgi:NAD-dependent SIR2 family protein deacetylase